SKNSLTVMGTNTVSSLSAGAHLFVLRYQWITNAPHELDLWIDPPGSTLATNEPNVPLSTLATTNGANVNAAFDAFYVYQSNATAGGGGTYWLDEFRVGSTWADVTPNAVCNTAGISSGATPASQTAFSGAAASFSVTASGSAPNYQWQL